jgi:hypothetical protein
MMRRCWIVGALALWVGGTGCTTTATRTDGPTSLGSRYWSETPAPPQRQVSLPPEREETPATSTAPVGLAKYFPGLRRNPAEPTNVATEARPAWFSFTRRQKPTQVYTTDARAGLSKNMTQVTALPVAIQVPSDRASDTAVTPARVEKTTATSDLNAPAPASDAEKSAAKADMPPLGTVVAATTPPGTGDKGNNSLPPAEGPDTAPAGPVAANRMPDLPPVDPRERPRLASPAVYGTSSGPLVQSPNGQKSDDQALKAIPSTAWSSTSDDSTDLPILTAFFRKVRGTTHTHSTTVLASPQSLPSPQAKPSPQVAPRPPVKPSPQVIETTHNCVCENCGAKIGGKKPCILKRMRKAIFQGETAAPSAQASR